MALIWPKKAELLNYTHDTSCVINVGDLPQVKIKLLKLLLYYCKKPFTYACRRRGKGNLFKAPISPVAETERTVSHCTSCGDNQPLIALQIALSLTCAAWGANKSMKSGCRCRVQTSLSSRTCAQGWLTSLLCCSWGIWAFRNSRLEGKERELAFMQENSRNAWTAWRWRMSWLRAYTSGLVGGPTGVIW